MGWLWRVNLQFDDLSGHTVYRMAISAVLFTL